MHIKKILVALVVIAVFLLAFSPLQGLLAERTGPDGPLAGVVPVDTPIPEPAATATPEATAAPAPTATPSPTPTPAEPISYLEDKTWLTLYGRAWDTAPILGRLGMYEGPDDMAREIGPWIDDIMKVNGGKEVVPVIHLIYAMAIPCEPDNHCLLYLDTAGWDIVEEFIKPAAERGWHVILDSQLGDQTPASQVQRMIDRGYLDYPNVHVAVDPEFSIHPGEDIPGLPIGQIDASEVNAAQRLLDDLVRTKGLPGKKVFMLHQFGDPMVDDGNPFMITNKTNIETLPNVDIVIDADGFGSPAVKAKKYNLMTDHEAYPFIQWRAIKLFFFNPYEEAHHFDSPVMTWPQVFGAEDSGLEIRIEHEPNIIVVA